MSSFSICHETFLNQHSLVLGHDRFSQGRLLEPPLDFLAVTPEGIWTSAVLPSSSDGGRCPDIRSGPVLRLDNHLRSVHGAHRTGRRLISVQLASVGWRACPDCSSPLKVSDHFGRSHNCPARARAPLTGQQQSNVRQPAPLVTQSVHQPAVTSNLPRSSSKLRHARLRGCCLEVCPFQSSLSLLNK